MNRATRATASTLGVLVGLSGIDHGVFEMLQGNAVPGGVLIAAIGPAQRFWEFGEETALTIISNYPKKFIICESFLWTWGCHFG